MKDTIIIPAGAEPARRDPRVAHYLSPRLPPDILEDASQRLGFISAFIFIVFLAIFLVSEFAYFVGAIEETGNVRVMKYLLFSLLWALSILIFFLAKNKRLPPTVLLDVGLVYEVIIAACLSCLINYRIDWTLDPRLLKDVPLGIIILVFAVIVPNSFGRTLAAGVAAALTDPIMIILFAATGATGGPMPTLLLIRFLPHLISVVLALCVTRIMYGFGAKLTTARKLGSYELTEVLGHGGMGEVWTARHNMLARDAAVKLIKPEQIDQNDRARSALVLHRFEHEAQATAALRSPHTIVVYDFGITRDGTFYYVMELLRGLDLDKLVRQYGPLPPERVVYLLCQACHSLEEAHTNGLIHRDIKPANLIACRYGIDVDFLKILDFGLVKGWQPSGASNGSGATPEAITGTPAFMPPEIALGRAEIDGRADIYALGCVAYWLVTGLYVFPKTTAVEMVKMHIRNEPQPPSVQSQRQIPADLEAVIMQCLQKSPADRPQTAAELARRLQMVAIENPWTQERRLEWWNLHAPTGIGA